MSIVCAVDGREPSRVAVHSAGWLAQQLRASLELVYVLDPGDLPALAREGAAADPLLRQKIYALREERSRKLAHRRLQEIAAELPGMRVSSLVCDGRPVAVLQRLAAERDAALLVSGTAARHGAEHVLQGSVAGSLAAKAPCPVVTVPPGAAVADTGPVLVGDDGSEHGHRAALHAAALAEGLKRDLVRMQVEDGDPVRVMAAAGREQRACLVVTGTRGRGPVRTEVFGSVSTGLVRTAGRPVVLVPLSAGDPP